MESNGKLKVSASMAVQVIVWLVAALMTYGAMTTRVAVLEDRVDSLKSDLREIKQDVKELLRSR